MTSRLRFPALVLAIALSLTGAVALVATPRPATAQAVTPGVKPDFDLKPGQSISKTFNTPLIGSAEVRPPGGDDCRNNPVFKLTCAAHRIKLQRVPGYYLRISTSWLSQSAAGTAVPDIDTYLFYSASASFTNAQVGGTTGAMPEQMKLTTPTQDEYDLVIGAYAGAVTGYTLVVEYLNTAGASPTPAKADIVLSPGGKPFKKVVNGALAGYTGAPALYPLISWPPDDCRNDPTRNLLCDVYRVKLNRDKSKDAINFLVIELEWAATYTPDVAVVATAVSGLQNPNLDIMVWDTATHELGRDVVGGQESSVPERAALIAVQDEYDVVVQLANGANTQYTIRAYLSNEVFDKPFESLEQLEQPPSATGSDNGDIDFFGGFNDGSVDPELPALDLAPINPDADIAGIGLGVSEQFDANQLSLGGAARNTSSSQKAPSGVVLILALAVLPLIGGVGVVGALRRRRHSFI